MDEKMFPVLLTRKKDAEIEEERKELNSFRRNLQKQISEVEEELELQKRELNAGKIVTADKNSEVRFLLLHHFLIF